ncbi:MAG: hypothetical protein NVSMB13_16430 [Mycobacteriales bacterium]
MVLVEAGVLDADDGIAHHLRNRGQRHDDAVRVAEQVGQQRAVRGQDAGALGQRRHLQLAGQALEGVGTGLRRQGNPADDGKHQAGREDAGQCTDGDGEGAARQGRAGRVVGRGHYLSPRAGPGRVSRAGRPVVPATRERGGPSSGSLQATRRP